MRVNITANTCTIDNNVYLNAGEYNINKFYFTFSEEYLDEYVKKALFIDKDGTPIKMVIANNECDIPYDILKNPGTYTFGVYAYEMEGNKLILRYSPEPTHFYVNKGSYIEGGTSPTDPTPDEFAQYYQAMQDLIANAKPELIDYIEDNLPTIRVGDTSTLTPNSPATVTNVGTERNPIFDFGIPQGIPGTTDYNELSNKPDLTVFALITESANKIALEMDPTEFKIKAKIFDKNNRIISESNIIDLPLESVVVSGEYDAANKKIILTLENGSIIEIPVEDLIDGLATKTELEEGLATKDANIIESISKNGAPLPVNANKNVNITVPTRTSEVLNDSGFITNDTNGLSHYYNKTAADTRFSLVTETGSNFTLSIDPATFVMTATLKDKNGRALSVQTVDLPLESVVVGGSYDSETREVVLTLENGSVVRFSVADLVSGLQSEITDSNKLSSDLVDDTNSVNKFITTEEKTQITTNENDISDIKDEQAIQNEHLDELDMIYNAFPTVSAENETIQLDNTAKVKFREIDLKGNTSQVVIPEEQGTSVSNTSIYVSDVDTDKEHTIEMSGNTYQETTTGKNLINIGTTTFEVFKTYSNLDIPAGTYTFSAKITSSDTDASVSRAYVYNGSTLLGNFQLSRNTRSYATLTVSQSITEIILYASNTYNNSVGDTATYEDVQLESGSTATDYEPYTNGASPNPSYSQNIEVVTGTQNVEVCGKNLLNTNNVSIKTGANFTGEEDNVYTTNSNNAFSFVIVPVPSNTNITFSMNNNNYSNTRFYFSCLKNKTTEAGKALGWYTGSGTILTTEKTNYLGIVINIRATGVTGSVTPTQELIDALNIQVEVNNTVTTYEQYQGTIYQVNLGNIELCKIDTYKDRIYKSDDKWYLYKETGKVVLNGSENWFQNGTYPNVYGIDGFLTDATTTETRPMLSDYFTYGGIINSGSGSIQINKFYQWIGMPQRLILGYNSTSLADFKTWLSTHNTTVYYPLATPTTTEITDTTLVSQLTALYNSTLYSTTNINTETSNLLPYIDLQYNIVTSSPSPSRPSQVNVVKGDNVITIANSDNTESQTFPINLGDMELCKIGTYQDYIYESNGNWFKKGNIGKVTLDGSENWQTELYTYYLTNFNAKPYSTFSPTTPYAYANYFKWGNGSSGSFIEGCFWYTLDGSKLRVQKENPLNLNNFKTWLSTHNTTVYYILATPTDTQITDTTLITQLNNIKKAYSYDAQTNISQTNTDKPFIIYAEAIDNNDNLLTDYVKNTDYATMETGGVVKVGEIGLGYSIATGTGANAGKLEARILTYTQYQNNLYTNGFVGKGTLENVITGKGLVSNTDYATGSTGGVIKVSNYFQVAGDGTVYCGNLAYNVYQLAGGYSFISKGTLENVITGKDLTTKSYVDGLVGDISSVIDAINGEVV